MTVPGSQEYNRLVNLEFAHFSRVRQAGARPRFVYAVST